MFEDFGKMIGDFAQTMMKKTGEVAEIASLHTKILGKKKKVQDEMTALGKAFYEAHKEETTEFADKIVGINNLYAEISALEEEIKALKEKLPEEEKAEVDAMEQDMEGFAEETKSADEEAAETGEAPAEEAAEAAEEAAEAEKDAE